MKRTFLRSLPAVAVLLATVPALAQTGNVAVNNDGRPPHATAILDVSSNYASIQKGMLIPRLTYAQRTSPSLGLPGVLPQGLTVYQTDNGGGTLPGFYMVEYGQWFRIDGGANSWDLTGNNLVNPPNDYFGTRDDQDLVFKANNVQVMRVKGTPGARYVQIGTTAAPNEQLDVSQGIRIWNPSPGSWAAPTRYAATNSQGTILFRPTGPVPNDSLESTVNPPGYPTNQNKDVVMWTGHWGNVDGTGPNVGVAAATAGGWRRLENEYTERFSRPYTQQGTPTCGAGTAELSYGSALYTNGLPALTSLLINPFKYDVAQRRWRNQYMFLKQELNVETNQLNGNPTATGGLCAGSAINTISFWVNQATALNNSQRALQITLTVKHAPVGVNTLTTFENSADPAAGCYTSNALVFPTTGAPIGWQTFTLSTPFIWDGTRNVIVEMAIAGSAGGGGNVAGGLPVRYSDTGVNLTYGAYTAPPYPGPNTPPCTPTTPTNSTCNPLNVATALGNCGTALASNYRPVIQFGGQVTTAPAATSGSNAYLHYYGGLIAEVTPNWSRQITPYYAFKGKGTISAESGVFDNGTQLNDHVFDRAFDGAVKPSDAVNFGNLRNLDIQEMADHTRQNRHLPTMKGRDSWRVEKGFSLGDLTNQLWTTAETQALYVAELNERLNVLELLSNDRPLDPQECETAKASVCAMNGYTDAEKAALLKALDERTVTTNQR